MSVVRLGINGFGRIGRCILRVAQTRPDLRVVAVNDRAAPEALAHMFAFDSVHGRYDGPVTLDGDTLDVGGGPIRMTAEAAPEALVWDDVDIALDCTGRFRDDAGAARHLQSGAGRVLISAPSQGDAPTLVYGINHRALGAGTRVASSGSCTTNCLAPVAQVLHSRFGILRGTMTTVHSYTGAQPTHDRVGGDLTRDRAGAISMVPTSTGAADAIGKVMPALDGRLISTSIRVPVPNVSCIDLTAELATATSAGAVNAAFRDAAAGELSAILEVEDRPLVSRDYLGTRASATVQLNETGVLDGTLVRVLAWYDNEWAFAHRMLDLATFMHGQRP